MADIYKLEIVIDRGADLAPQVVVYREAGIPWKIIERLAGRPRNRLEEQVATWRRKQAAAAVAPAMV